MKTRILIVEDEAIIAMPLRTKLQQAGYEICGICTSGAEVLQFVEEMAPDLILMDIHLDGHIDGVHAAEQLRQKGDLPIVYVSGSAGEETMQRAKYTAPVGYILKPFTDKELLVTIEMALHNYDHQQHVKEQGKLFYKTLSGMTEGVITLDNQYQICFMNAAAEQLTGWMMGEAIGLPVADVVCLLDEQSGEPIPDLPVFRQSPIHSYSVMRRTGAQTPVEFRLNNLTDENEQNDGMVLTFKNVSEARRMSSELLLFRRLIDNANDALFVADPDTGRFLDVNRAAARSLGYSTEEMLTLRVEDIAPAIAGKWPGIADLSRQMGQRVSASDHRRKDGTFFPVEVATSYVEIGNSSYFVGVARDISDRKKLDLELQKLSLVAQKTDNAVVITDKDGIVEWVNEGFTRISGYSLAEMVGKKPGSILQGPESDRAAIERIRQKIREKKPFYEELLNYRKDGQKYWAALNVSPILDDASEIVNFIGIQSDITKRKQIEEQLRQAKDNAEAANHAKSEFLANMSHELRTPLNGILSYAQILGRDASLSLAQLSGIKVIEKSGHHLLDLINDILDLAKIEARRFELTCDYFSLDALLKDTVNMLRPRFAHKSLAFHFYQPDPLPPAVYGDSRQLSQILINLLGNAAKFTKTGEVRFTVERQAQHICFEVADTGIGIPEDKLPEIFAPFKQLNRLGEYEGTGLGLAISRQLVELMGGTLYVRSVQGKGSTFGFALNLPVGEAHRLKTDALPSNIVAYDGARRCILIVDDRWENRIVAVNMLTPLGFEVIETDTGAAGIQAVLQYQPDLVLMDLRMPDMNGFEATRLIRANKEIRQPKVFIVSASVSKEIQRQSLINNADKFLAKPLHFSELLAALQTHLGLTWLTEHKPDFVDHVSDAGLIFPPNEILHELFQLINVGAIIEFKTCLDDFARDPNNGMYNVFIAEFQQLTEAFDIDRMTELLKKALQSE